MVKDQMKQKRISLKSLMSENHCSVGTLWCCYDNRFKPPEFWSGLKVFELSSSSAERCLEFISLVIWTLVGKVCLRTSEADHWLSCSVTCCWLLISLVSLCLWESLSKAAFNWVFEEEIRTKIQPSSQIAFRCQIQRQHMVQPGLNGLGLGSCFLTNTFRAYFDDDVLKHRYQLCNKLQNNFTVCAHMKLIFTSCTYWSQNVATQISWYSRLNL